MIVMIRTLVSALVALMALWLTKRILSIPVIGIAAVILLIYYFGTTVE